MRKSFAFYLCCILFSLVAAQAQQQAVAPSDPKALMLAASKLNNLATDDAKPWHIKATFQLLDEQGTVIDEGTYEEFWASPTKFKRILTGKTSLLTDYGSEKGMLRGESHGDVPDLVFNVRRDFTNPLPDEQNIERSTYLSKPVTTSGLQLTCVSSTSPFSPTDCIDNAEPLVRISAYPTDSIQILRNRILRFDGRAIPGDLKEVRGSKVVLTAHVDTLEALNVTDEALFSPPPDATREARNLRIMISGGVAQGMIASNPPPTYPADAKAARVTGTVVMAALISKDGRVENLQVTQGPPMLRQAAMDAVRTWRYKPYLLNGEPVQVQTTINVIFEMR